MKTECGIFAVLGHTSIPPVIINQGMRNIQHRGQDSYGMIRVRPQSGLISEVKEFGLLPDRLIDLQPSITLCAPKQDIYVDTGTDLVLGHTRYSTVAATIDKEAIQPIELSGTGGANSGTPVYIAFNGNLPHVDMNMRRALGIHELEGSSDTFLFRAIWQRLEKQKQKEKENSVNEWELGDLAVEFVQYCINRIPGAYSCVVLVGDKLIGFRDRYGYKPLWCYWDTRTSPNGIRGFISETVQLGQTNISSNRHKLVEVPAGSFIVLDAACQATGQPIINRVLGLPDRELSRCSMEAIYFMQDSSLIRYDDLAMDAGIVSVRDIKYRLGEQLAKEELGCSTVTPFPQGAQVIYVPESSYPLGLAYSREMGLEFVPNAITKIYNIRSFIESNTEARVGKIKRKFEFAFDMITSQDVIIIDDSLVRGNTMNYIISQLRDSLPDVRIHIRIASPVLKDRCWFGIDIAERDELIYWQTGASLSGLQNYLKVVSIQYLSVDGLQSVLGPGYCQFCFGVESSGNRQTLEW